MTRATNVLKSCGSIKPMLGRSGIVFCLLLEKAWYAVVTPLTYLEVRAAAAYIWGDVLLPIKAISDFQLSQVLQFRFMPTLLPQCIASGLSHICDRYGRCVQASLKHEWVTCSQQLCWCHACGQFGELGQLKLGYVTDATCAPRAFIDNSSQHLQKI